MKKKWVICLLLLVSGWYFQGIPAWAIDVGWMQKGVRVWYFGGAGSELTSNAEEAYLFTAVDGGNAQVTHHSALDHWGSPNAPETATYSVSGTGPCWIHPQVLQTLASGDHWMGYEITLVTHTTYTYNTIPPSLYCFLPLKTLFDLTAQREVVKIVYMIAYDSTGTAYFDAQTGLLLQNATTNGSLSVLFVLSEINYTFATKRAFAEDDGPHTGFKSFVSEQSLGYPMGVGGGSLIIQSLVETRYGNTVEMRVLGSDTQLTISKNWDQNHCFFGNVPILRYMDATLAPNYPPEQWNALGEYLWWWVPQKALQKSTINIIGVPMARTSTAPYTFTATGAPAGLYFSTIVFGNDGYMTVFSAKDSDTGMDIDPGDFTFHNGTTVYGLDYYRNTMGQAQPRKPITVPVLNQLLLN